MLLKSIIRVAVITLLILMIPLVGMQFSNEVDWNTFDFIVAGIVLFGSGLSYEAISRKGKHVAYKAGVCMAFGTMLLLMWVNLAVGIIGSEDNPLNLLYFGVILFGIVGMAISQFKPRGMARALLVTALLQALVPIVAYILGKLSVNSLEAFDIVTVLGANTFFVVLFIGSAMLFRHASMLDAK